MSSNSLYRRRSSGKMMFQGPHGTASIISLSKKADSFLRNSHKNRIKKSSMDNTDSEFTSVEVDDSSFFQQMQKIQGTSVQFNQFVFDYLQKLKGFYLMLKKEYETGVDDILRKLSIQFRINSYKKNTLIYNYGDISDKYYMIFKGEVDLLFPYYEKQNMSAESMIIYLLRLKRYNEMEILTKIIEMNGSSFIFGDKKFDIWLIAASNTLYKIQNKFSFWDRFELSKQEGVTIHKRNKRLTQKSVDDVPIDLVNYAKNWKFINKIEKELIETFKVIDVKNNSKNAKPLDTNNEVSSSDYIKRILPPVNNTENITITKEATIMKYCSEISCGYGAQFGEVAMDSSKNKMSSFPLTRLCTVITKKDTHLGHFEKKSYLEYIKAAHDNNKRPKVDSLRRYRTFIKTKKHQIIKNYSSFFKEVEFNYDEYIFKEKENQNEHQKVYFVIDGEFEVFCNKTIVEIDQLLSDLGFGEVVQDRIRGNTIPETKEYFEIMKVKTLFRLTYFKYNEVIGLKDSYHNNHYHYSVQCKSKSAKAYVISTHLFEYLLTLDEEIHKSTEDLIKAKKKLLAELLIKHMDTKLKFSFAFNKTDEMSAKTGMSIDLFKKQRNVPYVPRSYSSMAIKDNDIDITLINTSSKVSLAEIRHKKTLLFLKKYKEKIKQMKGKPKINPFKFESKLIKSASDKNMIELNYSQKSMLNKTSSEINPLVYDNFDRIFNTSFYFQKIFDDSERKYNIKLVVPKETHNNQRNSKSCNDISSKKDQIKHRTDREVTHGIITTKLKMIYNSKNRLTRKLLR